MEHKHVLVDSIFSVVELIYNYNMSIFTNRVSPFCKYFLIKRKKCGIILFLFILFMCKIIDKCSLIIFDGCFQEYLSSGNANLVRSLMYMIEMLMKEACEKEDAHENRHLRTWLIVRRRIIITSLFYQHTTYDKIVNKRDWQLFGD